MSVIAKSTGGSSPGSSPRARRTLRLKTSHHFVPDRLERNGDQRQLAVRVYELTVEPIERDTAEVTPTSSGTADPAEGDSASTVR